MMSKRVFLVVLDSFGVGNAPDADAFGDDGSNTLAAVCSDSNKPFPNLAKMGLFEIDGHKDPRIVNYIKNQSVCPTPIGTFGRIRELAAGKDSTIGHWEISGVYSASALPTYPNGFPEEIINELKKITGREILCNKPYSGTAVIADYGEEHMKSGALIVYTSADSVLQIAAHEDIVPVDTLYEYCAAARKLMSGEHGVGRVIARPFAGKPGEFYRTSGRHDYSLSAPSSTMLDILNKENFDVISIGKIKDLFAGRGITEAISTTSNTDGIAKLIETMDRDFNGLCFVNLVDFDMKYGHRNDIRGYADAMHEFDDSLDTILNKLREDDLLIITADHGCDPSTESTDHSREMIPVMMYGIGHKVTNNIGTKAGFGYIAQVIYDALIAPAVPRAFTPETGSNKPDPDNIFSYVDLTNLKVTATYEDIESLVDTAIMKGAASVCVPPCFVRCASNRASGRLAICTVIGFPNGYSTTASKVFEAVDSCNNGASEIDMVININNVKAGRFDLVTEEISQIAEAVHARGAILKVIIETCYLTEDEKVKMCNAVTEASADFIKTSTGFGTSGATIEDVRLMRKNVGPNVRIKAAGGIRSEQTANEMIDAGAIRIGSSGLK